MALTQNTDTFSHRESIRLEKVFQTQPEATFRTGGIFLQPFQKSVDKKQSSFAGAKAKMRLGDRRSVTDYAQQRLIDQNAWRRTSPCLVDFTTINDSNRRDGRRADRAQLNTLWDKRTGDENRPLFNFLLAFRSLVDRGIGKHCFGKHAGRDENCGACKHQRLHK